MNPGTFTGLSVGAAGQSISRYTQSPTITSSRTIAVPEGVKRIEALLCGGGGGGGLASQNGGGGGFGGLAIIEIPVTGSPLQVVIGAGGAAGTGTEPTNGGDGSPTYIVSAGTRYAEVGGGGGGGGVVNGASTPGWPGNGRSGGGGGGASQNNSYIFKRRRWWACTNRKHSLDMGTKYASKATWIKYKPSVSVSNCGFYNHC